MNKSQRIYLETGNTSNVGLDMHIKIKLEQDVDTLEFLTMKLDANDAYQNFNSDYGVLIGRVLANGGVGIPNTKISVFIPLTDSDANDGEITSIYPYTTPRDTNNEGKRYNLLPRVSQYDTNVGTYKPAQPFGSFLIKPELVSNQPFLDVYKKYYKYTALTNDNGDYMIFGVPVGTQTVHMSVDITDIGKYSMSPQSMITAGYPANLFTKNGNEIKPSQDLNDLPNIETQEIDVNIFPFWGDITNFEIGITRQDFRVRANIESNFVIFGTSMTMGQMAMFGNPNVSRTNRGFYAMSYSLDSTAGIPLYSNYGNIDIRVNRVAPIEIKVFSILPSSPNIQIDSNGDLQLLSNFDPDTDIVELFDSDYYKYVDNNGNFALSIPCNQVKIITDDLAVNKIVDNNSTVGVFSKFFGMVLARYPDVDVLPINSYQDRDFLVNHPARPARGWFKIPQSIGLIKDDQHSDGQNSNLDWKGNNDKWRKEYFSFSANTIYSIAQFFPTKNPLIYEDNAANVKSENTFGNSMMVDGNTYTVDINTQGGAWFKVAGENNIGSSNEKSYDDGNYIIPPRTNATPQFEYDFSPNVIKFSNQPNGEAYFGGQWLNFCLFFPQFAVAHTGGDSSRTQDMADVYFNNYIKDEYFMVDNNQKIFAGLSNTKNLMKGDSFRTNFIVATRKELEKLNLIDAKGINIRKFNEDEDITPNPNKSIQLSAKTYMYQHVKRAGETTTSRQYNKFGWDDYSGTYINIPPDEPDTAYLFKGMYNNDCIKLVLGLGLI